MNGLQELKEIASKYSVLYVEDDKEIANTLINYLSKFFNEVIYAKNGEDGLALYKDGEYDIVITDIMMPKMNGLEMSEEIKKINENQNIIVISAYSEIENFLTSIKLGIDGYIIKPVDFMNINSILFKTVKKIKAFKDNEEYENKLKSLLLDLKKSHKELEQYIKVVEKVAIVSKTDLRGVITYVNDFFCKVSGYSKDELLGKSHNIVRHEDVPKDVYEELWQTIQSGKIWEGTIKNKKKNGEAYYVYSSIIPIFDDKNTIKEYIGIRFLTTQKEIERRDFKKKVMTNYIEFKKTNMNAIERINEQEKELNELKNQDLFLRNNAEGLNKKNKKNLLQIKFLENELKKKDELHLKALSKQGKELHEISKSHSELLNTLEKKKKKIDQIEEENKLKTKQMIKLNEEVNEQSRIIMDLRDTIRTLNENS